MSGGTWLVARTTLARLARRRLAVALMIALPLILYVTRRDAQGQALRALLFGVSWATTSWSYFAARSAAELEPRLVLAGARRGMLLRGRLLALALGSTGLVGAYLVVALLDQRPRDAVGVAAMLGVTALVGVAVGAAVGALLRGELDGTLVVFFLTALQVVVNPFDAWTRVLPFWSSRELATYAVDGPSQGSLLAGLLHAAVVVVVAVVLARWGGVRIEARDG